jgi:hypothetical protein
VIGCRPDIVRIERLSCSTYEDRNPGYFFVDPNFPSKVAIIVYEQFDGSPEGNPVGDQQDKCDENNEIGYRWDCTGLCEDILECEERTQTQDDEKDSGSHCEDHEDKAIYTLPSGQFQVMLEIRYSIDEVVLNSQWDQCYRIRWEPGLREINKDLEGLFRYEFICITKYGLFRFIRQLGIGKWTGIGFIEELVFCFETKIDGDSSLLF